jgi:hypothetical protein
MEYTSTSKSNSVNPVSIEDNNILQMVVNECSRLCYSCGADS